MGGVGGWCFIDEYELSGGGKDLLPNLPSIVMIVIPSVLSDEFSDCVQFVRLFVSLKFNGV